MFNSIATLFSNTSITRTYQIKPSLAEYASRSRPVAYGRDQIFIDKQVTDILQNLHEPVENWIIQKQPYLRNLTLNNTIFKTIISQSKKGRPDKALTCRVTIHNLFVLLVQYKVLNQRIKEMKTQELQLVIDGLSAIYLQEEKGPFDQLTCLMHFIICNSPLHEFQMPQGSFCLWRPIQLTNISYFFRVYKDLQDRYRDNFLDMVVNVIPLLAELFKVITKTDQSSNRYKVLQNFKWIRCIGCRILKSICRDIDNILSEINQTDEQPVEEMQQVQSPMLSKKLYEKSQQLLQVEGFVSSKVLFMFAFRDLYYLQHVLRLHKYMMELSTDNRELSQLQQKSSFQLVTLLCSAACKYQVNLPDTSLQSLSSILSMLLQEGFDLVQIDLKSVSVQSFINRIKITVRYQLETPDRHLDHAELSEFGLQEDESLLYYILKMLFNLKLEYIQLLHILMQKTPELSRESMQFYLIKNGLMHFLIEHQQSLHSNDKKCMQNYFNILGLLLKGNSFAHCILDEILTKDIEQKQKCMFVQYVRKNFYYAKQFLLVLVSDTISINLKRQSVYFLPVALRLLLYSELGSKESKHDVWISYIHDVIVRELRSKIEKEKVEKVAIIEKELNEWVTVCIMLQIQCMLQKGGSELQLGQFIMRYLTNILNEAIKWKYEQTEVMRRLSQTYQEWEIYYTQTILDSEQNQDMIQSKYGPLINFVFLRKWNRKICRTIKLFIESVESTVINNNLFG